MNFKTITLPDNTRALIPTDINLVFPKSTNIDTDQVRSLAFIPWGDQYLEFVPEEYKPFFKFVLPHLHARTTDVHTAICLPLLTRMLNQHQRDLNRRVIYIALILHDCGWSQLSDKEIADSLSYSGAIPTSAAAKAPKVKHAELGSKLSREILDKFEFSPSLTDAEKEEVCQIVLHHDLPTEQITQLPEGIELYLLADADRLWSYTHENFWQDTIRKNVPPAKYLRNLSGEIDDYFSTEIGRALARQLLQDRQKEVKALPGSHAQQS